MRTRESRWAALVRNGRLEEAAAHYSQALRPRANQAGTHFPVGQTLALQEKIEDGARHLEAAVRLEPNHARARSALADLRSGITRATPLAHRTAVEGVGRRPWRSRMAWRCAISGVGGCARLGSLAPGSLQQYHGLG